MHGAEDAAMQTMVQQQQSPPPPVFNLSASFDASPWGRMIWRLVMNQAET